MSEKKLVKKLANVMKEVKYIEKKGYNKFHKYNYATEADVNEKVREELAKVDVVMIPNMLGHNTREHTNRSGNLEYIVTVDMEFKFIDGETGEEITFKMSGSGQDAGDKGIFKAISGAQKYALMKAFMIPTGDDPEQDAGVDERNNRQSNPKANGKSKKLSEAQVKRLYAIAKNNGHTTADVKKAIMKLYNKTQAEDLTKTEYDTLISRIEASQQSEKRAEPPPVKTLPDGSVDPDDPSFPF